MNPIELNKLTMHGKLAIRANLILARLETEKYWPETIFGTDQNSWPLEWMVTRESSPSTHSSPSPPSSAIRALRLTSLTERIFRSEAISVFVL